MTELAIPPASGRPDRRHRLGYVMIATAAVAFAVNGVVAKLILTEGGISSPRLTELRSTGAFVGLAVALLILAPGRLRVRRDELPLLVFYGICAFALVQWLYFVAIERLPIGVALVIQFTAPIMVALWARFAWHESVRPRVWGALALSLVGLGMVTQVWSGFSLDTVGVAAAGLAAVALAAYFIGGERGVGNRDALSLVCLAMGVASLFWAIVQPWWSFPFEALGESVSLGGRFEDTSVPVWALALWMIIPGTIIPFTLSIGSLAHLPAIRVAAVAMLEPPIAAIVAWWWLGEDLAAAQVVGGALTLVGIMLAQTSRSLPRGGDRTDSIE